MCQGFIKIVVYTLLKEVPDVHVLLYSLLIEGGKGKWSYNYNPSINKAPDSTDNITQLYSLAHGLSKVQLVISHSEDLGIFSHDL